LIAGSNGAGKTTFFHWHLRKAGLRFINAEFRNGKPLTLSEPIPEWLRPAL